MNPEPVTIFIFFVFVVYPILAAMLIGAKIVYSRAFLQLSLQLKGKKPHCELIDEIQDLVWSLRSSYIAYDTHISKLLEAWFFKIFETNLLDDRKFRNQTAETFGRIFLARVISDPIVQMHIFSQVLHSTHKKLAGEDADGYELNEEALEIYMRDLEKIRMLVGSSLPIDRIRARLAIDNWIEGQRAPLHALPSDYLVHAFLLKYALTDDAPFIRWVPVFDEAKRFSSFSEYIGYSMRSFLSSYWVRFWTPLALMICRAFPSLRGHLVQRDPQLIAQIIDFARARFPTLSMSPYALTVYPGGSGVISRL